MEVFCLGTCSSELVIEVEFYFAPFFGAPELDSVYFNVQFDGLNLIFSLFLVLFLFSVDLICS